MGFVRTTDRAASRRAPSAATLVVALVAVAASCTWSAPRGDLAGTASSPAAWGIGIGAVGSLVERWQAPLGGLSYSTPVLSGSTVVAAGDGTIRAYDAAGCGAAVCPPIWQAAGTSFGQPSIDGDLVYVPTGSGLSVYDLRGGATCSGSPRTCAPVWTADEPASYVLAGNGLVVATGSSDGYVFEAGDGSGCPAGVCEPIRVLEQPPCSWIFGCSSGQASMGDGVIAVGWSGGEEFGDGGMVTAYDLDGGEGCTTASGPDPCEPRWVVEAGSAGGIGTPPAIVDGSVVYDGVTWWYDDFTGEYTIVDHDVTSVGVDGAVRWTRTDESRFNGAIAVADGTVFGSDFRTIRALDRTTGSLRWTASTSSAVWGVSESDGVLYVATESGVLAFDAAGTVGCGGTPRTCSPIATLPGAGSRATVSISNGLVWVAGTDGTLRAFGLAS